MPASRTPKRATRKDKGNAPATPRRSPSRSPPIHYAPLFSHSGPRKPTWLDRVLVVLFMLYFLDNNIGSIAIKTDLVNGVEKRSHSDHDNPLAGGRGSWLTNIYNSLASLHDHRQDHESIKLTQTLKDIFNDLSNNQKTRFRKLSSLNASQHRALCRWFREYCKKNQIKTVTKHEGYMNQMDIEKANDDLQAEHNKVIEHLSCLGPKGNAREEGQSEHDIEKPGEELPAPSSPTRQNAVAGPSRLPQTPRRPSTHNSAGAYPTPESRPRRTQSDALHGGASTTEPLIRALSLPAPAGSDTDNDDFYDANDEMDVDDPSPPSRTCREVELELQVTDLMREKTELMSRNAEQLEEIDQLKFQIAELDRQIKEGNDAKEKLQKELEEKEGRLGQVKIIEAGLRSRLENFEPDKLENRQGLEGSHAKYGAFSTRLERENAEMREELSKQERVIEEFKAAQKRNLEAVATFQANFAVVSPQ
ncbi:hypothetical protein D9619_006447 [Psilocybe cf. subviscida]|uniref:Uncharacterized protein n=1 Tax=Psilocybe cf. subviscida TaxID=2480587 RepID=A0A8H5B4E4_9AGAR|nr:hypothetical protein D9619_006447 [Psilocybe cf. subviscida]